LKILQPSDDPVGATRAIKLTELLEQQDQILSNLQFADRFLAQTDSTMNDINDLLIDAQSGEGKEKAQDVLRASEVLLCDCQAVRMAAVEKTRSGKPG